MDTTSTPAPHPRSPVARRAADRRVAGRSIVAVVVTAVAVLAAACSAPPAATPAPTAATTTPAPASSEAPPPADEATVVIAGFAFTPASIRVSAGTTVTWSNDEDSLHAVTSGTPDDAPGGRFDSGELDTGESFTQTFAEPGTYPYFCSRHPFMRGEVVVGD